VIVVTTITFYNDHRHNDQHKKRPGGRQPYERVQVRPDSAWLLPFTTMPQVTDPPAGTAPS
jgi:hypothetical protein